MHSALEKGFPVYFEKTIFLQKPSCLVEFCKWVQLRKVPPRWNSPTSYTFDLPKSTWREATTQSLTALIIFVPNFKRPKRNTNWISKNPRNPIGTFSLEVQPAFFICWFNGPPVLMIKRHQLWLRWRDSAGGTWIHNSDQIDGNDS